MPTVLLQMTTWDRVQAIRDRLNQGGGLGGLILAVCGIMAVFGLAALVYRLQQRRRGCDIDHPGKLYRSLLRGLGLPVPQRDLLRRITAEQRLENPTVLLLSRRVFQARAERWLAARKGRPDEARQVEELARRLFPAGYGATTSANTGKPPAAEDAP